MFDTFVINSADETFSWLSALAKMVQEAAVLHSFRFDKFYLVSGVQAHTMSSCLRAPVIFHLDSLQIVRCCFSLSGF